MSVQSRREPTSSRLGGQRSPGARSPGLRSPVFSPSLACYAPLVDPPRTPSNVVLLKRKLRHLAAPDPIGQILPPAISRQEKLRQEILERRHPVDGRGLWESESLAFVAEAKTRTQELRERTLQLLAKAEACETTAAEPAERSELSMIVANSGAGSIECARFNFESCALDDNASPRTQTENDDGDAQPEPRDAEPTEDAEDARLATTKAKGALVLTRARASHHSERRKSRQSTLECALGEPRALDADVAVSGRGTDGQSVRASMRGARKVHMRRSSADDMRRSSADASAPEASAGSGSESAFSRSASARKSQGGAFRRKTPLSNRGKRATGFSSGPPASSSFRITNSVLYEERRSVAGVGERLVSVSRDKTSGCLTIEVHAPYGGRATCPAIGSVPPCNETSEGGGEAPQISRQKSAPAQQAHARKGAIQRIIRPEEWLRMIQRASIASWSQADCYRWLVQMVAAASDEDNGLPILVVPGYEDEDDRPPSPDEEAPDVRGLFQGSNRASVKRTSEDYISVGRNEEQRRDDAAVAGVAKRFGMQRDSAEALQALYRRLDSSSDGSIDQQEFTRFLHALAKAVGQTAKDETHSKKSWHELRSSSETGSVQFPQFATWLLSRHPQVKSMSAWEISGLSEGKLHRQQARSSGAAR